MIDRAKRAATSLVLAAFVLSLLPPAPVAAAERSHHCPVTTTVLAVSASPDHDCTARPDACACGPLAGCMVTSPAVLAPPSEPPALVASSSAVLSTVTVLPGHSGSGPPTPPPNS